MPATIANGGLDPTRVWVPAIQTERRNERRPGSGPGPEDKLRVALYGTVFDQAEVSPDSKPS